MTTNTEAFEAWYQKDLLDAPVHQQHKDKLRRAFEAGAALASASAQPLAMMDEREEHDSELEQRWPNAVTEPDWQVKAKRLSSHCRHLERIIKGQRSELERLDRARKERFVSAQGAPKVPGAKAQAVPGVDALMDLVGLYWEIAYEEGETGQSLGTKANLVLSQIRSMASMLAAAPQPATGEQRKPLTEGFTADVECITDESGTEYSVAVRGPGIRNPLYSDVWLKKKPATLLAKWLNGEVFPAIGIRSTGGEHE